MDSAAKRLQHALSKTDRHAFIAGAKACGMDPREVGTAFAGRTVSALTYMRLCALSGIDPQTGKVSGRLTFPRIIAWEYFASALRAWRKANKTNYRASSHAARISKSTLSAAGRAQPVNAESFLAVCRLIGWRPDQFLICGGVSRETSTRTNQQFEVRP